MKFYCITRKATANPTTIGLLKKACQVLGVNFILVESYTYDFSRPVRIDKASCLYNLSVDQRSIDVFNTLIREDIATVFDNTFAAINFKDNVRIATHLHEKAAIPIIKTIFDLTRDKAILKNYVKTLGGFPVIIKAEGGSHGVGIIKVDNFEGLTSLADYLVSPRFKEAFLLRQYIDYEDHARLIVLNGKVLDSVKYHRVKDDFRSNAGKNIRVEAKKFSTEVENIAIKAVNTLQACFGGVDILIDKQGNPYLAEVNISCYFPRTQLKTGNDIATQLVEYLVKKAEKQ